MIEALPPVREACCANCGAAVEANRGPHCPVCGAHLAPERLGFRRLAASALEHALNLDFPFLRTLIDMFRFPGRVAAEYVAGRRRVYSNPLKYYLITGAIIVTVIHFVLGDRRPGEDLVAGIPDDTPQARAIREAIVLSMDWHNDYIQVLYLFTLPACAWLLRLALGRGSQRRVVEFFAMLLLLFGQVYLIQAAFMLLAHWIDVTWLNTSCTVLSGLSPWVYVIWATAGFTRGSRWRAGILSVVVFLFYTTCIQIGLIAAATWWLAVRAP